jgi:flagellar biogenesis protein FliO
MTGPTFDEVARLVGTLLLIVGGLFVVSRAVRARRSSQGPIRVLARLSVAKGAALMIVSVEGRRLLIAAGERGVNLVTELGEEHGSDEERPPQAAAAGGLPPTAAFPIDPASIANLPLHAPPTLGPGTGLVRTLRLATVRRAEPRLPSRAKAR